MNSSVGQNRGCQRHLHTSLRGCAGAMQTAWHLLCFLSTFFSLFQRCDNFLQFIFLRSSITKSPEQCQRWRHRFKRWCRPLALNTLLVCSPPGPCLFSKLKNRNSKSSPDPCQIIADFKSNICLQKKPNKNQTQQYFFTTSASSILIAPGPTPQRATTKPTSTRRKLNLKLKPETKQPPL